MGKKVVLVENDIWSILDKDVKPQFIQAKSFTVMLGLEVKDDKAYKALDDDPLLLQELTDIASVRYKRMIANMRTALIQAEKKAKLDNSNSNLDKITKRLGAEFNNLLSDAQIEVAKEAVKVIDKLNKTKRDAKIDTASFVFSVVGAISGLTFAVVSLITTPFTAGVGGVAGIIGMARGIVSLSALLANRAKSIDKLIETLRKDLKSLGEDFKANEKKARATDLAKEAFNALIFPADILNSSKKLEGQLGSIQEKLRKMEVDTHDLASDIKDMIAACEKGSKEVDKMLSQAGGNKDVQAKLNKAAESLDKCQKKLMQTIDKVISGQAKVKSCTTESEELEDILEDIRKKKSKIEKIGETLMRIAADLSTSALSTDFTAAADVAAFTIDLASATKDLVEEYA